MLKRLTNKVLPVLLLLLINVDFTSAATITYTNGGGDSDWHNPLNWDLGLPSSSDDVIIPSGQFITSANKISLDLGASISIGQGAFFNNFDTIIVSGTFFTEGDFFNSSGAVFINNGLVNNFNIGSFINNSGAVVSNNALFVVDYILNTNGEFINSASGVLTINNNFYQDNGLFENNGVINISMTGFYNLRTNPAVFTNNNSFNNDGIAQFSIDNFTNNGLVNNRTNGDLRINGVIENGGTLLNENMVFILAGINNTGSIENRDSMILYSGGTSFISQAIDAEFLNQDTAFLISDGIFDSKGDIINNGTIKSSVGTSLIISEGFMNNTPTGSLLFLGLLENKGDFISNGSIFLGVSTFSGEGGLNNDGTFESNAVILFSGPCKNSGLMNLNGTSISRYSLENTGQIYNTNVLLIESFTSNTGVRSFNSNYFENSGNLVLNDTFENNSCSEFILDGSFYIYDSFPVYNDGLISVLIDDAISPTGRLINNGVIEDLHASLSSIPTINNELIISPLVAPFNTAVSSSFEFSTLNNMSIPDVFYSDESLSIAAGEYDQSANELISGLWEPDTLYFELIDTLLACTYNVKMLVTLPCNDAYEPNEDFLTSTLYLNGVNGEASLCSETDEDWYQYDNIDNNLKIKLLCLAQDARLELYNSSMALISFSDLPANEPEEIIVNAAGAGTFYIRVFSPSGAFSHVPYCLHVTSSDALIYESEVKPKTDGFNSSIVSFSYLEDELMISSFFTETFNTKIQLYDAAGRNLMTSTVNIEKGERKTSLKTISLLPGIYIVKMKFGDQFHAKQIFVKG